MKKLISAIVGILVLLVAAVLIVPGMIDWNHYKGDIQAQAKAITGRDLAINGDITITVLPAPALIANNVSLANVKGASSPHMMRLKLLEVRVALAPLLTGRVEVKRIKLVDPVVELEALADGRKNWVFDAGPANTTAVPPPAGAAPAAAKPADAANARVAFENITIENGTLVYRDIKAGTLERVEQITAKFAAASLNGPYESSGGFVGRGIPLRYDVNVGDIIQGRTVPFNLKLRVGAGDSNMQLVGTVIGLTDAPKVKGKIKGGGSSLAGFIDSFAPGASLPPFLSQDFSFEGNIAGAPNGAEIKDLSLRFGSTQATGDITVENGKTLAMATRISANKIDLDKWLAMTGGPVKPGDGGVKSPAGKTSVPVAPSTPAASAPFAIPTGVSGSLIFSAEAMAFRGGVVRDAVFNAELSNGEITISQLSGQFPGGSDIAVFGFINAAGGEPHFEGSLESTVNDFHGVLKWLGVDVQGIAPDRLRKLTLATRVAAGTKQVQFRNLDLQFDSSRLTGGVTMALTRRPSFGADLTLDRLNLDAYLPAAKPAQNGNRKTAANAGAAQGAAGAAGAAGAKPGGPFQALQALTEFDANLKARIATLAYRNNQIKDVVFDGTIYNGKLEFHRLGVAKMPGATATLTGTLDKLGATPVASGLKFDVGIDDVPRFLRFIGMDPSVPTKNLGAVALKGRIDGALTSPRLNLNLEGAGVSAGLDGQIEAADLVPVARKLKFHLTAADAARALKLVGIEAPAIQSLGAVKATGEIDGNLIQPNVALNLNAAGGSVAVNGPVNVLAQGDMVNFNLTAHHPDAAQLLRSLAGYRPAGKIGALDVAARLTGGPSSIHVSGLTAKAGEAQFAGEAKATLGGARPKITVNLTSGPVLLDPFLPAQKTALLDDPRPGRAGVLPASFGGRPPANPALRAAAAQPGHWSREPIDLSALNDIDADVAYKSPSVQYQHYKLENADIAFKLANGKLAADKLTGMLFGGQLNGTALATASKRPHLETAFSLDNMSVKSATGAVTGQPLAGGTMSMKTRLQTTGANMADMMGSLSGDGSFQMKGVDVSQAQGGSMMSGVFGLVSALNQFTGGLGGAKKGDGLADISGSFQMAGGIARSRDLKLVSNIGNGAAQGAVDLGRWQIDVSGQMQLAPNVLTALLSKKTGGKATQAVPFYVTGRLDAPNVRIDTSKLPGGVLPVPGVDKLLDKAPKGVGNLLQGILGGGLQPQDSGQDTTGSQEQPAPQTQQQQPQQKQKTIRPEDLLKGLLRR